MQIPPVSSGHFAITTNQQNRRECFKKINVAYIFPLSLDLKIYCQSWKGQTLLKGTGWKLLTSHLPRSLLLRAAKRPFIRTPQQTGCCATQPCFHFKHALSKLLTTVASFPYVTFLPDEPVGLISALGSRGCAAGPVPPAAAPPKIPQKPQTNLKTTQKWS